MSNDAATREVSGEVIDRFVAEIRPLTVENPDEVRAGILQRIATAGSFAEAFKRTGLVNAEDVLNVPLEVRGVRWNESTFVEGLGVYAVLDAVRRDTGQVLSIGCGGENVAFKMRKAQVEGWFPCTVQLVRGERPTSNGFYVLDVIPA